MAGQPRLDILGYENRYAASGVLLRRKGGHITIIFLKQRGEALFRDVSLFNQEAIALKSIWF